MKTTLTELGAASEVTRDYSGNYWWDNLVYDFKQRRIFD
jgi:hypothetical protein